MPESAITNCLPDESPARHSKQDRVSVVVPTYCEAENLDQLVSRVSETLDQLDRLYEIIIVDDDSPDETASVVERLQAAGHPLRLITRKNQRGLSSAVIEGFQQATGETLICMDADLSHPPESLPRLIEELECNNHELVIGSRYVAGACTDEHWGWFRRLNSRVATLLARPFTNVRDPMAGFFALPRLVFDRNQKWDPIGYKVGLEILVKTGCRRIAEVPIHFADRRHGQSKLNWREQLNYLRHLLRLAHFKFGTLWHVVSYGAVGSIGAMVDLGSYATMLAVGIPVASARAWSILLALAWTFVGNDRLTFRASRNGWKSRCLKFAAVCGFGGLLNYGTTLLIYGTIPASTQLPVLSACFGIGVAVLWNFSMSRLWVFSSREAPQTSGRSSSSRTD